MSSAVAFLYFRGCLTRVKWKACNYFGRGLVRTAGNTLLMRIVSNLYIKVAAPGWPSSDNTKTKITSAELASLAFVIRPLV